MPNTDPSAMFKFGASPAIVALANDKARIHNRIEDLSEKLRVVETQPDRTATTRFLQQEIDHCEDELVVLSSMMDSVDIARLLN